MSTRSILVSYAGYPYTFNSLMPDNGLANLAGALLCAGHETVVLDYGTLENIEGMFPRELARSALSTFSSAMERLSAGKPLGQDNLAKLRGFETRLHEQSERRCRQVAEEICNHVTRRRPDFVGFKLWNGDGFFGSVRIAETIKSRHKNLKLFAGGPHVDIFRENIYRATEVFDALAFGEGEETVVQLAEFAAGKRRIEDVDNVIFRRDGEVVTTPCRRIDDLDSLPFPCYEASIYPAMDGESKIKLIVLDESRGCPFSCHFCIHPIKSGPRLRKKSAKRIVEEMTRIMEQLGTGAFRYAGSSTPTRLGTEIADLILKKGLKVAYAAFGNAANAGPDGFERMSLSGCRSIFFGIESGSDEILRQSMGKKATPDRIAEVIVQSKRAGIFTVGSIIFPSPLETEESERATAQFLREVRPDSVVVQFPILYPGTQWMLDSERFGISFDEKEYVEKAMTYKAKPLMPLEFWDDLPFSLDGKNFSTTRREAGRFARELERDGIVTSVSDDLALIAALAGYGGREGEFRGLTQAAFFSGNVEWISRTVAQVNGTASRLETESDPCASSDSVEESGTRSPTRCSEEVRGTVV